MSRRSCADESICFCAMESNLTALSRESYRPCGHGKCASAAGGPPSHSMVTACDGNTHISFLTTLPGRSSVFLQNGHRVRKRSSNAVRSVRARQATQSRCLQHCCVTPRFGQPGIAQRKPCLLPEFLANLCRILRLASGCA